MMIKLLSNGHWHTTLFGDSSGPCRWRDLALTRWREDAVLDRLGSFLLMQADGEAPWSATHAPSPPGDGGCSARFDGDTAVFERRHGDVAVHTEVAVDAERDVELRRSRIVNHGARPLVLRATSFAEVVLAEAAADAAHPAFSKLFVETEIDAGARTVIATRRPSKRGAERPWCARMATLDGAGAASWSFETSRAVFVGRGRELAAPQALLRDAPLGGHAGPVLDAVLALQARFTLAPGQAYTLDIVTAAATSRDDCLALARDTRADDLFAHAGRYRAALLQRIGADAAGAALYEHMAEPLLVADAAWRGSAAAIPANRRGQSALWAYGISGDVPIVLLTVGGDAQLAAVDALARAHAFWAAHGIRCDAIVLAAGAPLRDAALERLRRGIGAERIDQRDGIVVRDRADVAADDATLLQAAARIVVDGAFADGVDRAGTPRPAAAPFVAPQPAATPAPAAGDRIAFNGHGGFAPGLREYVIDTAADRPTPAPWCNVIANADFGTLVTESGSACTWSENAHEFRLTPWSNDPVSDPNAEGIWIRDAASGAVWSPTPLPAPGSGGYVVRHGFGTSRFEHAEDGIDSRLQVFVAADAPVKLSRLTLTNSSQLTRELSVTAAVDWVLGDERAKTLAHVVTERDASGAVFACNGYNTDFAGRTAFFDIDGDIDGEDRSVCCDRAAFYGVGGSRARPLALQADALDGSVGAGLDPCAALQLRITLAPGATRILTVRLGCAAGDDAARALVRRWRDPGAQEAALDAVQAQWQRTLGKLQVRTPDPAVDALANGWLLYQVIASRLWARAGYYQSSGAYGFRDQLQDVMALCDARPDLAREQLLRAAGRQFDTGDVQHWWHPPGGKGIRSRCSDDYLWLPFVAARYVEISGDAAVLDAPCSFVEQPPLADGETSSYAQPQVTAASAPLHDHCVRAIRRALDRSGAHGLPLMDHGDWNDGMDAVGEHGRGESVWLAFFLVAVLAHYGPLARARGDTAFADDCAARAKALGAAVDAAAWDGRWYLRAWFDDGKPLGSAAGTECQIDSIAQSWAVLSGAAPAERARTAMDAVHERLVRHDMRLIQLLDPAFDAADPWPGYIAGYVPGVRENGAQYTHGATWTALAFAALGDADRAWQAFDYLNPVTHGSSADAIAVYKVEPYVMAGDVYSSASHPGRGGWTWYSGSAGWMHRLLTEALLGIVRRGSVLTVRPLLPRDWPGFSATYSHGTSRWLIDCRRGDAASVTLDGALLADGAIPLHDNGREHAVTVTVTT